MKSPSIHLPLVSVTLLVLAAAPGPRLTDAASILFYFAFSGPSHISSIWPVIENLGNRGHSITLLASVPPKVSHPAVSVVPVPEILDMFKDKWLEGDLIEDRLNDHRQLIQDTMPIGIITCTAVFTSSSTQHLLHNSSFDLIVLDTAINECAVGLATLHYKCPFMVYNALSVPPATQDDYGAPVESSWLPETLDGRPVRTFWDRLTNTWRYVNWLWVKRMLYYPALAQIFVERLKLSETPDIAELQKRTSLILLNGHYAHTYAMSLPPLFVSIAGVAMKEKNEPLPKPLADFIATGKEGFIYVSFGTQVQMHNARPELQAKFLNAFRRFPELRFIWKWEGAEKPADAPPNIHFANWLPQQDLLAHPSARGYIAHGGMNGLNEGVHYGTPMIVFPVFGDQDFNAHALGAKGLGLVMELRDFSEQELVDNINLILHHEPLKARVKRASAVFRDRAMKPVDTAVWWIEFVLRYGGDTSFLMPEGVHQSWYERRLLDVWFFVYTVLLAAAVVVLYIGSKLVAWLLGDGPRSKAEKLKTT